MPTPGSIRVAEWAKRNPEKRAAQSRRHRKRHRAKITARNRVLKHRRKERDAGRPIPEACEVCAEKVLLCFDHDHTTGKFRGWLCHRCNFALGHGRDDPRLLRLLADYLEAATCI